MPTQSYSLCTGLLPAGKPTRAQVRPNLQNEIPSHATDMDRRSVILRSALASAFGCMYNPLPALAMDAPTLAHFPGALPSLEAEAAVYKALSARGYNDGSTAWLEGPGLAASRPSGRRPLQKPARLLSG
jgi:hypothetical protein